MDPMIKEREGLAHVEYCPYCMTEAEPDKPCPNCGLTAGSYKSQPKHLPAGAVLKGRYLLGRVLGEGGFGITYIGRDLVLGLKVAIKEYFPTDRATRNCAVSTSVESFLGDQNAIFERGKQRFLEEARTMARLDRLPNIVAVRDFFEENSTAYIVMEYIDGTTLSSLVEQRGGVLPAWELLHLMEPLFDSLGAMHEIGLIHRDISPDNLMLEHGIIKLLDFGCARESAAGDATMTIMLRHGYAPVEQYQSSSGAQGPWTDVYALAATIYFCITGKKPPQAMDRIFQDGLVPPRKLGADLSAGQEAALLKALSVQPKARFQSAQEFHTALYEGLIIVHLNTGAGKLPDVSAAKGDTLRASALPVPEREGFDFAGWYLDPEAKRPFRELTVREETTLYAGWREREKPLPVPVPFWKKRTFQYAAAAAVVVIAAVVLGIVLSHGGGDSLPDTTEPPGTQSPAGPTQSQPPETKPSETQPPETEPPETQPPETEPPETQPPETKPPETQPPETKPPETQPPETKPPETQPPETKPPETQPPATKPPETQPPATEPPETQPPATEPPVDPTVLTAYGMEELLAGLADSGIKTIIYCGDTLSSDAPINITKPVTASAGYIRVTSPVYVSSELRFDGELCNQALIAVNGSGAALRLNGKYSGDGLVRTRQGGTVHCGGGRAYSFAALWLAGDSGLILENGSTADAVHRLVYDEDGSFDGASHVNSLQELRDAFAGSPAGPVVLDSSITLDGGAVTVSGALLISKGVTVGGEGQLEVRGSLVNNGTVEGGVDLTGAAGAVLVNNGTWSVRQAGFQAGMQIVNLGEFAVTEGSFGGVTILNLGKLSAGPGGALPGIHVLDFQSAVIVNLRGANRDINLEGPAFPLLQDISYDEGCTLYATGSLRMSGSTIILTGLLRAGS